MFKFNFLKNRKSRKELLKEIDKLKTEISELNEEIELLENRKEKYFDLYMDYKRQVSSQVASIQTISAVCLSSDDTETSVIKECLCYELAKQIIPYVKHKAYRMADYNLQNIKHIGEIQIFVNRKEEDNE